MLRDMQIIAIRVGIRSRRDVKPLQNNNKEMNTADKSLKPEGESLQK